MNSNVLSAFIAARGDTEYLCAECDYSYIGVDDAIYAKRKIGEEKWQYIDMFEHDKKQPCSTIYVFGFLSQSYLKSKVDITLEDFRSVLKELEIEE